MEVTLDRARGKSQTRQQKGGWSFYPLQQTCSPAGPRSNFWPSSRGIEMHWALLLSSQLLVTAVTNTHRGDRGDKGEREREQAGMAQWWKYSLILDWGVSCKHCIGLREGKQVWRLKWDRGEEKCNWKDKLWRWVNGRHEVDWKKIKGRGLVSTGVSNQGLL